MIVRAAAGASRLRVAGSWLLLVAACALGLFSDGGSSRLAAPAGPVTSHPSASLQRVAEPGNGRVTVGRERTIIAGLARVYAEQPASVRIAARLVEVSLALDRTDWLRDFATALARRLPTASTLLILAEVEYASGGYSAGIHHGAAAHAARAGNAEVDISYAAALAATGEVLQAYALVADWGSDAGAWPGLSGLALQRLATIAAAASSSLGERLTTLWMHEGWLSRNDAARSRALSLASSRATDRQDYAVAAALAREALRRARDSSVPAHSALAVMNAADVSTDQDRLVGRMEGVCQLLPEDRAARADCLVSALERAADLGSNRAALRIYRILSEELGEVPLLSMRIAAVALPLLELTGAHRDAAELAQASAGAASEFGGRQLLASFQARLARARRLVGDYPAASTAANRAIDVAPERSLAMQRASREASAARRASEGGTAARDDLADAVAVLELMEPMLDPTVTGNRSTSDFKRAIGALRKGTRAEAAGDDLMALKHYLTVLTAIDSSRRTREARSLRSIELMDVWQAVTRRAVGLALRSDDPLTGLNVLERYRSPSATTAPRHAVLEANRASTVAQGIELPPSAALAAFVVGPERTWVMVARHHQWRAIPLAVSTDALRARVELWRELAKSNAGLEAWSTVTNALSRDLIEPLEISGALAGVRRLYIVPDDILHLVPFATLVASRDEGPRGRYLVTQSPSLAALRRALSVPARKGYNVAFGLGGSGVFDEVRGIRDGVGRTFLGPRATESEWRRQAAAAAAIHFGGHARQVGVGPGSGALQLTADARSDGLLTTEEILATPLPGATVVLIGCDTATRLEEPSPAAYYSHKPSIGEAFLRAGARSVVGHLWPITEEDALLLVGEFHRAGGVGRGAAALEEARQRLRARFPDQPRRWAGAVWLGAAGGVSGS